ncbi:hypothetical protein Gotri_000857 [Gossypium trilobum]|uniref:Uncharacterized protein n=1 Tax=Gossypium trilobum TaxID=34281 RepID=A0A7J9FES9_9ROSI|nr:hypothetical protein [Gossypium trilobum]
MEASHILTSFETEEQSSSESGWTMYIGSSIHENVYNTYEQESHHKNHQCPNGYNEDESDDSMASDASSGPSHHKFPPSGEQNSGMNHFTHGSIVKSISTEKLQKQVIKRDQRRNRHGKGKLKLKTISAPSRVQRGYISKDDEAGRIGVSQISQSYLEMCDEC